jgi:hypothetical protein
MKSSFSFPGFADHRDTGRGPGPGVDDHPHMIPKVQPAIEFQTIVAANSYWRA